MGRLAAFLELLPVDLPACFEFRHESWLDPSVTALLTEQNRPLVWVDQDDSEAPDLPLTADWAYLRLRRAGYSTVELEGWQHRLAQAGVNRALVFFKHEDEGAGPALARAFLQRPV